MRFAVIGNPIAHSKSPEIHQAFAAQFGIELRYEKMLVERGQFSASMDDFFKTATGCNVTVPFKTDAFDYADRLSPAAQAAGAVNTLYKKAEGVFGDNTDGIGLVRDLQENLGLRLADARVLIVGAGGATRGVILPLLNAGVRSLTIANRTESKAEQLVGLFADTRLRACGFEALASESGFELIINATSASLTAEPLPLPDGVFACDGLAYDMVYGAKPTVFMQQADDRQMRVCDGLGMLIEQAAASFELWHQRRPQTAPVIEQLRAQLRKQL